MTRLCLTILLFATAVSLLFGEGPTSNLRARLTFTNGFCYPFTHIELVGAKGVVAEGTPDDECQILFENVAAGTYELRASGENLVAINGIISSSRWIKQFPVEVKAPPASARTARVDENSLVSVADLRVPTAARKELGKANELAMRREFTKAIDALHHAVAIYPSFAGAYNSLGVIYGYMGEREQEREALETAVHIDDHFALALMNLGRMSIRARDYLNAEPPLRKASALAPGDPAPLLLLGYAQLMAGHWEEAIATSQLAHWLHSPHAFAHRIAARAFEQEHQLAKATAELEMFLTEGPSGSSAMDARKELENLGSGLSIEPANLTADPAL